MKKFSLLVFILLITSCSHKESKSIGIEGSWKLFYNQIKQGDSIQIKDVSKTDFIKIINKTHFAFINQPKDSTGSFYAGGGTYTLKEDNYSELLQYIDYKAIRNHQFDFKIELKGDTLIQFGREKVEGTDIDREIVEKYFRLKP